MSVSTAVKPSESPHISPGENSSRASRTKNKLAKTPSTPCVLPILEGGKPYTEEKRHEIVDLGGRSDILDRDKTFLTGINDFIPDDILNSLTQNPTPPSREQLGPPTKHKKLKPLEVSHSYKRIVRIVLVREVALKRVYVPVNSKTAQLPPGNPRAFDSC